MDEYSRILIEQYCMDHSSAKSRRLQKLVENGKLKTNPMKGMVAAVSVGIVMSR